MSRTKTNKISKLSIKVAGFICISSLINVQAQQVYLEGNGPAGISYLESKNELEDYILDTGDEITIRFKNRPRKALKQTQENKISKSDISYLEPRKNLDDYILDSGDTIYIDFKTWETFSGNYSINSEGEVYLPRINNSYVKGLKVSELEILLKKRYEEYLISPDIEIRISQFKFITNGVFRIDEEGEILLPSIPNDQDENSRKAFVRGLTTNGLKKLLEKRYSKYLMNPEVFISISSYKPIRIAIRGEVRSPGLLKFPSYTSTALELDPLDPEKYKRELPFNADSNLDMKSDNNKIRNYNQLDSQESSYNKNFGLSSTEITNNNIKSDSAYLTTLSNAIRGAGGFTSYSDISQIEIIRDVPIKKGGGKKRAIINFLPYITESDDKYDLRLFDGDSIFIPSLREKDPSIVPNSILSGLSPKFIRVAMAGRISSPGEVEIPIEGSLSDAMNLTGPRLPLSGKINLIRYNKDGTILREDINYSANAIPGSTQNPYLVEGDLITVKNSVFGRTAGALGAVTAPFVGIYTSKEVINRLFGLDL